MGAARLVKQQQPFVLKLKLTILSLGLFQSFLFPCCGSLLVPFVPFGTLNNTSGAEKDCKHSLDCCLTERRSIHPKDTRINYLMAQTVASSWQRMFWVRKPIAKVHVVVSSRASQTTCSFWVKYTKPFAKEQMLSAASVCLFPPVVARTAFACWEYWLVWQIGCGAFAVLEAQVVFETHANWSDRSGDKTDVTLA